MSIPPPEYHEHDEFKNRLRKLQEIRKMEIEPYPYKYSPTATPLEAKEKYKEQEVGHSDDAASGSTDSICVAGRLVLFRAMGKNAFGQIQDFSGRIQFMCNRDLTEVEGFNAEKSNGMKPIKFIEKMIDLGDIIGIEGHLFRTQKGELTIYVKKLSLLCKTLLPLPDKHAGLADKGTRYRKRWLDMIANQETINRMIMRTRIIKIMRKYFDDAQFTEVETPVLQTVYGGAEASPFETHLNALHQDMFMRISLEIPLKKLIVGGLNKVYEVGKVFRNEGLDRTHNPEFTEVEAYAAYWDYNDMMNFIEGLFETVALELFGTTQIRYETKDESTAQVIELKAPWKRLTMKEAIKTYANIDVDRLSEEEMRKMLIEETDVNPKEIKELPRGSLIAAIFEEFAESHLIQPHHIIDHPIETTPLCKLHRDPNVRKERIVERFESFILAREFTNAYSELNDPVMQRELLLEQAKKREAGAEHTHPLDEEFIESICQGMPPCSGIGMGVDRFVMLFTQAASIRDVLFFPIMRPEEN